MERARILESLGLSPRESRIYLALVEHGPLLVAEIARETGLPRPSIYQAIPALKGRGLVTVAPRGKQKRYAAESPERLEPFLGRFTRQLQEALAALRESAARNRGKPLVKFLTGSEGIKFAGRDLVRTLKRGDVYYRYSSRKQAALPSRHYYRDYERIRAAKHLQRFVITNETVGRAKQPNHERAIKFVPPDFDLFAYNISKVIYGPKVAYMDYDTETTLIIENSRVAEFEKKLFLLLYRKL